MTYDFTLDKKGMFSVLVSSVLMGALLFVAGLIVGSYWTANGPTVSAATAKKNTSTNDLNALPQQPVLMSDPAQSNLILPNNPTTTVNSGAFGPGTLTAPPVSQAAKQPQAGAEQPAAAEPDQGSDNKQTNAPAAGGAAPQTAKPEDSSAAAQNVSAADLLTVEVGTFLDTNAANRLFKSLERKGYAPTFFTGRDAQAREWYAIRIGAYSDKQQAENAAANLSKQEKIKAVVRPLGSL
jgi:cell division septation protein DedD